MLITHDQQPANNPAMNNPSDTYQKLGASEMLCLASIDTKPIEAFSASEISSRMLKISGTLHNQSNVHRILGQLVAKELLTRSNDRSPVYGLTPDGRYCATLVLAHYQDLAKVLSIVNTSDPVSAYPGTYLGHNDLDVYGFSFDSMSKNCLILGHDSDSALAAILESAFSNRTSVIVLDGLSNKRDQKAMIKIAQRRGVLHSQLTTNNPAKIAPFCGLHLWDATKSNLELAVSEIERLTEGFSSLGSSSNAAPKITVVLRHLDYCFPNQLIGLIRRGRALGMNIVLQTSQIPVRSDPILDEALTNINVLMLFLQDSVENALMASRLTNHLLSEEAFLDLDINQGYFLDRYQENNLRPLRLQLNPLIS